MTLYIKKNDTVPGEHFWMHDLLSIGAELDTVNGLVEVVGV